jgi:hypothetical protein
MIRTVKVAFLKHVYKSDKNHKHSLFILIIMGTVRSRSRFKNATFTVSDRRIICDYLMYNNMDETQSNKIYSYN